MGAQVQVDPAASPLDLIDLTIAVVLTAGVEGEQLGVPRERLEGDQHVSYDAQRSHDSALREPRGRAGCHGSPRGSPLVAAPSRPVGDVTTRDRYAPENVTPAQCSGCSNGRSSG